jgi:hypothetical protein
MGKRGNGEGSITRRKDGLYMARYTVQTATGSKRRALYGKTRGEVSEKLTKAMANRDGGFVFDADNLKVEEYMTRWLADSVRDTVRRSTFARYEQITRLHVIPAFGRTKLKNLSPAHVRGLYREKLDAGLSARTVQYVHATLHKALKQAVADGLIPRNVTEAVKAPRPVKKEIRPLNAEQARTLLDTARGDRLEALYAYCCFGPVFSPASRASTLPDSFASFSSPSSRAAFLSSRAPSPRDLASSGTRLAPKNSRMMTNTITTSSPPIGIMQASFFS